MKRVFQWFKGIRENLLLVVLAAFLIFATYKGTTQKAEQEAASMDEIWEAIAEVCELNGHVWSWKDKSCSTQGGMPQIYKHRPTKKSLI